MSEAMVDSTLSVENLMAVFAQEYGSSVAAPPQEFFEVKFPRIFFKGSENRKKNIPTDIR